MDLIKVKYQINFLKLISINPWIKTAIVIILIGIIGLLTVNNYGVSWDEPLYIKNVLYNYELIRVGKHLPKNPDNIGYYGVVLDIVAESLYKLKNGWSQPIVVNAERIAFKHILTFLFSLLAYLSVAGIVAILCGSEYAWLGVITLALFPNFWGHSFFNPKDLPFAVLFILSTLSGAYLVTQYLQINTNREKTRHLYINSILFGALIGWLTSARIGGFTFLVFIPFTYLLIQPRLDKINRGTIKTLLIGWILIFLAWAIITTINHPVSWSHPIRWFLTTVQYHSHHGWSGTVLFDGQFVSGKHLPWYYLPKLIIFTVPEILLVLFSIGLGWSIYKYSKFSVLQKSCLILVVLQIFALPISAILKGSTLYDGTRHFLFILPGMSAIAASAIGWLWQKFKPKPIRLFCTALIACLFLQIVLDMATLHPYEYIYFNRLAGGLAGAYQHYETEYWGLSLREAMDWVNQNSNTGTRVLVAGPLDSARLFAKPGIVMEQAKLKDKQAKSGTSIEVQAPKGLKPDYYLAIPRWNFQQAFPECQTVYQVTRQSVPLTIVKQCSKL